MARPKKHRDLEIRVLELLDASPTGKRFNELVAELGPGSRTTLVDCLRSIVRANFIEQDYPTKAFKITELGKQVIGRIAHQQREMEFLLRSGIFKDNDNAVEAAIHLWLGLMKSHSPEQLVYILPIRIDRDGNLLGVPESE